MKAVKILITSIFLIALVAGCTQPPVPTPVPDPAPEPNQEQTLSITDIFPFHEDTLILFDLSGGIGSTAYYTVFTEGNRMQRLVTLGTFRVTEVFEIADGELRVNHARAMASGFENMLDVKDDNPMVILREPLVVGNSWETHTGPTMLGVARGVSTITAVDLEIETAVGLVSAIEVSTEFENGFVEVNYSAKGVGLVQSGHFLPGFELEQGTTRFIQEEMNVDMLLASAAEGAALQVDIRVYHPNEDADDLDFSENTAPFMTNGDIRELFESVLRHPGERPHGIISPNTTINFIDVSWVQAEDNPANENATVHLDLSEDFSNDMSVGITYEQLILASLEITFLEFFSADEFVLTVAGQPHVSIH